MDKRLRVQTAVLGSSVQLLTKEAMEALPTPRLLAYRKQLRRCGSYVREKQAWEDTMNDAKIILDTREHVEKKNEK